MENRKLRVSPALVLSIIALVLALTGSAIAAKRYLITNTKQISPAVLKQLAAMSAGQGGKGAPGANGAAGLAGPQGIPGPRGEAGPKGDQGDRGERGERGIPGPPGESIGSNGGEIGWAVVGQEGTMVRDSGPNITSSRAPGAPAGSYVVKFPSNVSSCVYEATVAGTAGSPSPAYVTVGAVPTDETAVLVQTSSTSGTLADSAFHLTVLC